MAQQNSNKPRTPKSRCESLFYILNGVFIGSLIVYLTKLRGVLNINPSKTSSGTVSKVRGVQHNRNPVVAQYPPLNFDAANTCLDPEGPLPVIVMSLGRSGTDSTWQILKVLTNTEMKAIEIVGGNEEETVEFFRALEGLPSDADTWAVDQSYDWRKKGGGMRSSHGFYHYIKDYCAYGRCKDGKWIFKWFCDEQQRYKDVGGLVGFKWKAYMSALRTEPAYNALRIMATLSTTATPIRIIRSRRNPLDVYLSELKHSLVENLPDHCQADDQDCIKTHSSIQLVVPVDEMVEWLRKTYQEENEVDATLSDLGIPTVHVEYDSLYYAPSEVTALNEWRKIFRFLGQKDDWTWEDISGAAKLKSTTKSRSHKVLIENFEEVYERLVGTQLEQFVRIQDD